ncbi:hypothetical protein [Methylovulum psychrotolerans]|uniref:hypothetical protein n=1 Tax=Methylovulum psychrotolerans TaxID=1704499 RepID=UPI0012F97090|nr:hypothetical protein [Methylovulum psychrotolerans]
MSNSVVAKQTTGYMLPRAMAKDHCTPFRVAQCVTVSLCIPVISAIPLCPMGMPE